MLELQIYECKGRLTIKRGVIGNSQCVRSLYSGSYAYRKCCNGKSGGAIFIADTICSDIWKCICKRNEFVSCDSPQIWIITT